MIETRFEFTEQVSRFIDEMMVAQRDLLNQSLSKGAAKVNTGVRDAFKRSQGTKYYVDQKQVTRKIIAGRVIRPLGVRYKHAGGFGKDNPSNMYHMIKNYLDEKNNLVVIMGRHPSFTPVKFRDGKRLGTFGARISGTSKGGVNNPKDIINILQKLNDGGTYQLTPEQSRFLSSMRIVTYDKKGNEKVIMPFMRRKKGGGYEPMIKQVTYKKRNFAEIGFASTAGSAMQIISSEYEKYFNKLMLEVKKAV